MLAWRVISMGHFDNVEVLLADDNPSETFN